MKITDHIFPALPIKHLIKQDGEPTISNKLETGTKPPVSNLCVLFCPCFVQKETAHLDTKALKMVHKSHKGFWGILVGIP